MAKRKALAAQFEAACEEVDRLSQGYLDGIIALQQSLRPDLPPEGVVQWFQLYLRVVDIGVEIRRGERRHQSSSPIKWKRLHHTGTKGAVHTGLSIDDANEVLRKLEESGSVKSSKMDLYFTRIDTLDTDQIGSLDARVNQCLQQLLNTHSKYYSRVEVGGSDPHQTLYVYRSPNASKASVSYSRVCFGPTTCVCGSDAEPWVGFEITATESTMESVKRAKEEDVEMEEVGLSDLKRQFGFEPEQQEEPVDFKSKMSRGRAVSSRSRSDYSTDKVPHRPTTAKDVYFYQCKEKDVEPEATFIQLFTFTNGSLSLRLTESLGQHLTSACFNILLAVLSQCESVVSQLDLSDAFLDEQAFPLLCNLLQLRAIRSSLTSIRLRGLALPRPSDLAILLEALNGTDSDALDGLCIVDLSYNEIQDEKTARQVQLLLESKDQLQWVSLSSCILSDPSAVVLNHLFALTDTCFPRLHALQFDHNCLPISLLKAIMECGVKELSLEGFNVSASQSEAESEDADMEGDLTDVSDVNVKVLQSLALSPSSTSSLDFLPSLIQSFVRTLQQGGAEMIHLHLTSPTRTVIPVVEQQLLPAIRQHQKLQSLTLRFPHDAVSRSEEHTAGRVEVLKPWRLLLNEGLSRCSKLEVVVPYSVREEEIKDIIGNAHVPKLRTLSVSFSLWQSESVEAVYWRNVFASSSLGLDEVWLDVCCPVDGTRPVSDVVQRVQAAWKSTGEKKEMEVRSYAEVIFVRAVIQKATVVGMTTKLPYEAD